MTGTPDFTGPELCRLQAHEVIDLLNRGEISPTDCLDAAFARIAEVEPAINAMPTLCPDRAYAAAANLDRSHDGQPGFLAGLPLAIKDLTPVEGVRTTFGTRAFADFEIRWFTPSAEADLCGHATLASAFVMFTRRGWDRDEIRFSSASGGLVARRGDDGMITLDFPAREGAPMPVPDGLEAAIGSRVTEFRKAVMNMAVLDSEAAVRAVEPDLGYIRDLDGDGLIITGPGDHCDCASRYFAPHCGIVGLRPSPGRAASAGPAGFMTEGAQGPMARSVRDCALFLDSMAGHTPAHPLSYPGPESGSFEEAVIAASPAIRIGFSADFNGMAQADAEVLDHLRAVLRQMQANGAEVEEACPDLGDLEATYYTLRGMDMAVTFHSMPEAVKAHFKQTLTDNMAYGRAMSVDDVARAQINRTVIYNNMRAFFETYDVLACPVVGCMPHPQTEEWVSQVGGVALTGYMDWLRFAFLATTAGLPAISVPVGPGPRGLPIGIQLIGRPRGEAGLLAAAAVFEAVTGGPKTPIDPMVAAAG